MRLTVALGGNALSRRGEPFDVVLQRAHVREAAAPLAELALRHQLVVTHGNGPQVGELALLAERGGGAPTPLDVLGAETEGLIGYLIEQELANVLPGRQVATLLTRVEVARDDPAFLVPTKPIGPVYDEPTARRLSAERGWTMVRDGLGMRRAVPSPRPRAICQIDVLRRLVEAGVIVVCGGGGGIPVVTTDDGLTIGVEAVIDKDMTSALLAESLDADVLVLLTDTPGVMRGWGTSSATLVQQARPDELRALDFEAGSMRPKIVAACRFVERTGGRAAIGALEDAVAVAEGRSGTQVVPPAARPRREMVLAPAWKTAGPDR